MKKLKTFLICFSTLFVVNNTQAKMFISFNGHYTNLVFSNQYKLWNEKSELTLKMIQSECEKQPENPDVWYIAGYYWQNVLYNQKKAKDYYKKSLELAPNSILAQREIIRIVGRKNGPEFLLVNFTNLLFNVESIKDMANFTFFLHYFKKNDTNELEKIYSLIEKNKNNVPGYRYALGRCALLLGKYETALNLYEKELAESTYSPERRNILSNLKSGFKSKLKKRREKWLKKYLSPFKMAFYKTRTLKNPLENPELFVLTSNAFALAKNQRERILAIYKLSSYCKRTYFNEITNYIDKILDDKDVSTSFASMLIRNMNTINYTNRLCDYCTRVVEKMTDDNINNIDNLISSLHSDNMGRERPEPNKYVLDLLIKKFPKNYSVLKLVANVYKKYGYDKDELVCRRKMLGATYNTNLILKTKTRIAELKIKLNQPIDDKKFLDDYLENSANDASAAIIISKIYLKQGKTNDAIDVLIKCANNKDLSDEAVRAADLLLKTDWENYQSNALVLLYNTVKDNYSLIGKNIAGKLMWKFVENNMNSNAINTFVFIAKHNDRPDKYGEFLQAVNASDLTDKIISEKVDYEYLLQRISELLRGRNYKDEAYKLRNYFVDLPGKSPAKYFEAAKILNDTINNGDMDLCDKIIDKIDDLVKQKIVPNNLPDSLYYCMLQLNLTNKCDSWVNFMLENTATNVIAKKIYEFSKWYMRLGRTNEIKNLVLENCNTNINVYDFYNMYKVLNYIDDTNLYKLYTDAFGDKLNKIHLVNRFGINYLNALNNLSKKYGADEYNEKMEKFIKKWFFNEKIYSDFMCYALDYAGTNKIQYLNRIFKNIKNYKPNNLRKIASMFVKYGKTNTGINVYSRILTMPKENEHKKIYATVKIAQLNIENKNYRAAIKMLDSLFKYNSEKEYAGFFLTVGDLYTKVFKYKKAVNYYIKEINRTEKINMLEAAIYKITKAWKYDSDIDYLSLAQTDFTNVNKSFDYLAKALLFMLGDDMKQAEEYIYKSEEKLITDKQKFKLWNVWINIAERNKNNKAQLLGRKKSLLYNKNKKYTYNNIYSINRLLMSSSNYTEVVWFNSNALNLVDKRRHDELILNQCQAYIKLGDTNSAWKTAWKLYNADNIRRIAYKLNKYNELIKEFKNRISTADIKNFTAMAKILLNKCWGDKKLAEQLALLFDDRMSEINVHDYVDLSVVYLLTGQKGKARKMLDLYINYLNESDRKKARKLVDKYLDLTWRGSLHTRGCISESENLQFFWSRRNER